MSTLLWKFLRVAVLAALAWGGVGLGADSADEFGAGHCEAVRKHFRALANTNRERDYRAFEKWVFAPGLPEADRRKRVEEAVWVLAGDARERSRFLFGSEMQGWADDFLARLERECGGAWWAWKAAGEVLSKVVHFGVMEKGRFRRGVRGWDTPRYSARERDRARARRCYLKALRMAREALAVGKAAPADVAGICLALAGLFDHATGTEPMRLTDLAKTPEISKGSVFGNRWVPPGKSMVETRSPTIGPDGQWRLPKRPRQFAEARSNFERILWLLHEDGRVSHRHRAEAEMETAMLWQSLMGVENLAKLGYVYIEGSELAPKAAGPLDLHTLKGDETIIVGPHGPERRKLPKRCRYIPVYRKLLADASTPAEVRDLAAKMFLETLADRRQYDALEAEAKRILTDEKFGEQAKKRAKGLLSWIGPDGKFVDVGAFVTGDEIEIPYVSRELDGQQFQLWHLDVEKAASPEGWKDWREIQAVLSRGWAMNFSQKKAKRYVSSIGRHFDCVAKWRTPIRKKPNHLQTTTRIKVPAREAGLYLVVAPLPGKCVVMPVRIARTVLVSVPLEAAPDNSWNQRESGRGHGNFFLLDAATGRPVAGAVATLLDPKSDTPESSVSDWQGYLPGLRRGGDVVVRRRGSPPEILGAWPQTLPDDLAGESVKAFLATSQPLYRPGQKVDFAGWLKRPNWRGPAPSRFPDDTRVRMRVLDPTGLEIHNGEYPLDEFGGFSGHFRLGGEIVLGNYEVHLSWTWPGCRAPDSRSGTNRSDIADDPFLSTSENDSDEQAPDSGEKPHWLPLEGRWSFDIGEFRKPDFRVTVERDRDAGTLAAVVRAAYHSGEPVVGARVSAKLRGWALHTQVFPKRKWDDMYWPGYDWPLPRTKWLEGWRRWQIMPEDEESWEEDDISDTINLLSYHALRVRAEGVTDEHGTARIVFPAKTPTPVKWDYDCAVHVDVTEFTGRSVAAETWFTETGRRFEVFAQPEFGFYRANEKVRVELRTLDAKGAPVPGRGRFIVEAIQWDGRTAKFSTIWETKVETGNDGVCWTEFTPPAAGQYRCLFEGVGGRRGFVLEVIGKQGAPGHCDGVVLIPRRAVCRPGEEIEVLVRTGRGLATVWLFEMTTEGRRRTPRLVETRGGAAVVKVPVTVLGEPEFYLRAAVMDGGKFKSAKCRIVVPPRRKRLSVKMAAVPKGAKFEPRQRAGVEIRVRDAAGNPVRASLAVTAIDQALVDLGGPLPKAFEKLMHPFYCDTKPTSSLDSDGYPPQAFLKLPQPGCFFGRSDYCGTVRREKTAHFEKLGVRLWEPYEPPELPNAPTATDVFDRGFSNFSATPAAALKRVALRDRFRDLAFWGAPVKTDEQGRARISFSLPDNLTAWHVQSWVFGKGARFGDAELEIKVSKPLQISPLVPRAAVVGDGLWIGARIRNQSGKARDLLVSLETKDAKLDGGETRKLHLAAGREGRARWKVRIGHPGIAHFRFRVRSDDGDLSDGAELPVPVAPRRVTATCTACADLDDKTRDARLVLNFTPKPSQSPKGTTNGPVLLRVRAESAPAVSALMVLPDLIKYPFGCTEQTVNRFLPAMIAWKASKRLGLDWNSLGRCIVRRNHPLAWVGGRAGAEIEEQPVDLSDEKLCRIVRDGLLRLKKTQNTHGWWGWFSSEDPQGNVYLTALALRALVRARREGMALPHRKNHITPESEAADWLARWAERRAKILRENPEETGNLDAFVAMVLAECTEDRAPELRKFLAERAGDLPPGAVVQLALATDPQSAPEEFRRLHAMACRRMAALDRKLKSGGTWWEDPAELHAWFLKLQTKAGADAATLRREVRALLALRRDGVHWNSTMDSALCVEAIIEAALHCGGLGIGDRQNINIAIEAAGIKRTVTLDKMNLWTARVEIPVDGADIENGTLPVSIHADGHEPVGVAVAASWQSADPVRMKPASHGIEVRRRYFLVGKDRKRRLLKPGESLRPGDLVEVELRLSATGAGANELEFVHLRDPIPAGLEPLVQRSGYSEGAYRECRTGETHFFFSALSRWNRTQTYHLRAVTPGTSTALPPHAGCMYAPDVFGQGAAREIKVEGDRGSSSG